MKYLICFFSVLIIFSCKKENPNMYTINTTYEFNNDFTIRADRTLKDSFQADSNLDAVKKASQRFAIATHGLEYVYCPNGLELYNFKKEKVDSAKLSTAEKKDLMKYLQPILDSLEAAKPNPYLK